jgi:hypothetical protein
MIRAAGLLACTLVLVACAGLRPTEDTLPQTRYPANPEQEASTLLVLLPGARDRGDGFERHEVPELVHSLKPDWDIVIVDAHMGYYRERSFVDRLQADVIEPARQRGYSRIWLSGPSLGGFGGLLYACLGDADGVVGIIALAPHLGGRRILSDIEQAGGPAHWQPGEAGRDFERDLWVCLRDGLAPDIWLGWGTEDRMDRGNRLLAGLLDEERVHPRSGGHRWEVWLALWRDILPKIDDLESSGTRPDMP